MLRTFRETWWGVTGVLSFWVVASKVFHAYARHPDLDMPTHFAGGAAFAFFVRRAIVNAEPLVGPAPLPVQCFGAVGGAAIAAVVWELLEFLSDRYFGTHLAQGYTDTLSDLFFGLSGAALYALTAWLREGRRGS